MQLLQQLLAWLPASPAYQRAAGSLRAGRRAAVQGLSASAKSYWMATLMQELRPQPFLIVAPGDEDVKRILAELNSFGVDGAEPFPALEISPYERISPDPGRVHQRQLALAALRGRRLGALVTTARALLQVLPPVRVWEEAVIELEAGMSLAPAALTQMLVRLGYRVSAQVTEYGEFSRRGGLLDVYSPGNPLPLRAVTAHGASRPRERFFGVART